jgi:heat shock protein HtpX
VSPGGSDQAGEVGGDRLVRQNRHRALSIAVLVGLVPGVVVGVVLVLVGLPVPAAAALVGVAGATAWWTWRRAPARVVRAVGGRPSDEDEHPRLHNLVDGLCASMGLPRPAIYVVDHQVPNAMTAGRDPSTACLVVTSALDRSLSLVQLEGVLAHELVHVKRGETVLAGMAVVAMAPWSVVVGVNTAAAWVHALVGPGREFSADQQAAAVVRYPPGIGSALEFMVGGSALAVSWPPGNGRTAALTKWLWIDPGGGGPADGPAEGNLDDTRVRAEAQSLL